MKALTMTLMHMKKADLDSAAVLRGGSNIYLVYPTRCMPCTEPGSAATVYAVRALRAPLASGRAEGGFKAYAATTMKE